LRVRAKALLVTIVALLPGMASAATLPVVISAGPEQVSVTLYRDPNRGADTAINRDDPTGFALITETRTVTLPAGTTVIRFEGVAGNILPESALVTGLPSGGEEKNLDADLLSPRSLFDQALGRRVIVRRTDRATGEATLQQATIRSSAEGAAVLQIAGAYTDYKCSGMPETLLYDGLPEDLSAKPTLSVRTTSPVASKVTLTLSYLAGGFDWQASYIVSMRADRHSADLFAWITLASSDVTSFASAQTQVVAGQVDRKNAATDSNAGDRDQTGDLALRCWPMPRYDLSQYPPPPPPPPPPAPMDMMDIVVTAQRRVEKASSIPIAVLATAEQLGDLKLYRFPTRVTIASKAQKQVAMLSKPAIKLRPVYRAEITGEDAQTWLVLRGKNRTEDGLGIALPGGRASIFSPVGKGNLLVGESMIADKSVGEDFEFQLGSPESVQTVAKAVRERGRLVRYETTVTNANPWPIEYEASLRLAASAVLRSTSGRLGKKDGMPIWIATVPANGREKLTYSVRESSDAD
jgi:hypothetical protein